MDTTNDMSTTDLLIEANRLLLEIEPISPSDPMRPDARAVGNGWRLYAELLQRKQTGSVQPLESGVTSGLLDSIVTRLRTCLARRA